MKNKALNETGEHQGITTPNRNIAFQLQDQVLYVIINHQI